MLPNQRHLFPMPEEIAYFNCASIGPQSYTVRAAGEAAMRDYASPWKLQARDFFSDVEELRSLFSQIIGTDSENVATIPAVSYGLAIAASNISASAGDRILLIADDFPSAVYTWRAFANRTGAEIITINKSPEQNWTEAILENFDERVKIISVPNVHWTNGAFIDLEQVGQRAREVDATFVIDASQSIGAMPFDVKNIRPDYLVTVGYKWLMGPYGLGYLYIDPSHHKGMPLEQNWVNRKNSDDFARIVDYQDEYLPGARKFDFGERSNFILVPMAIAALSQILEWGVENISTSLSTITDRIEESALRSGCNTSGLQGRGQHMLGIELPEQKLYYLKQQLAKNNIFASIRGSSIRISPHLYINDNDVNRLLNVLESIESIPESEMQMMQGPQGI